MKIAFIGLGIMGSRMAEQLLKNAVDMNLYNRTKEKIIHLEKLGASLCDTPSEAVADADIVITMLSTPQIVEDLMIGKTGAIHHMKEGALWVDCSTVNPSFSKHIGSVCTQFGIQFLDAPVAGTKPHAEQAELVFFVGGNQESVKKVQPYFDLMGKKVMHLGDVGSGSSFKMLVNSMLAQSMIIFSEALTLGVKMGLDQSVLLDTLPNLVVAAPFTKLKSEMIRNDSYEVQFPLEWMHKDLHLATLTAFEHNHPMFLTNIAKELFAKAKSEGLGRLDFAAIHKVIAADLVT